jgi:hypothetical protein
MVTIASALASINSDPLAHLGGRDSVERVCVARGHAWRERSLDPASTVSMFVRQIAAGNVSLAETTHLAGSSVTAQAYCAARQRLPLAVLQELFARQHERLVPVASRDTHRWLGHRTFLIDGSSFSMPDTPELRERFGTPSGQKPGCGFPVAHLLVLFSAPTGLLLNIWASKHNTGDVSLTDEAHTLLDEGDVLVGDDSFSGYPHLAALVAGGLHGVFPVHHLKIVDFACGRPHSPGGKNAIKGMTRSRWVRTLGHNDQIVEYDKPKQCPKRMSREAYDALPASIVVRETRRRVRRESGQRVTVTVVTTLLDPAKYPAHEVVKLRLSRWEVETNLGHLKTTMKLDVLRSRSVEGVLKELAMIALVYNMVRVVMLEAASRQGVKANRISFKDALCWLRHTREAGALLRKLIVNPHRPGRVEPRCRKRRMKEYDLMVRPRHEQHNRLKSQANAA